MYLLELELGQKVLEGERVGYILSESQDYSIRKIGARMIECAKYSRVYVWKNEEGLDEFEIRTWRCSKRGCLVCDRVKCNKHIRKLLALFDEYGLEKIKFVTCTFPKRVPVDQLETSMNLMSEALGKLFRKKIMNFVTGGFKAKEAVCKRGQGTFNPHCHMLIHHSGEDLRRDKNINKFLKSDVFNNTTLQYLKNRHESNDAGYSKLMEKIDWYLEQGLLHQVIWSALFKDVGMGAICDVKPVNKKSALEVAKYFTKTWEVPDDLLEDVFRAMKGKRLFSSFGDFKIDLAPETENEYRKHAVFYGTLKEVVENAVSLEGNLDLRVMSRAKSQGMINPQILDCMKLDSDGWKNLDEETRQIILRKES